MIEVQGWNHITFCRVCGPDSGCTDEGHPRYDAWELVNDQSECVASVQDFGYALYGTTKYGRTGPRRSLEQAQEACIRMLETGEP